MTEREIDVVIAMELMGWPEIGIHDPYRLFVHKGGIVCEGVPKMFRIGHIPDNWSPSTDLRHAAEAEARLTGEQQTEYARELAVRTGGAACSVTHQTWWRLATATPSQKSAALLAVLNGGK